MAYLSFLCAKVGNRHIAVPLERVIGVVDIGPLTPLPFSPPLFEGLVQAMGHVVPQVALGSLLGEPQNPAGVLIVITDIGGSLALRVDETSAMVQIESENIESISAEEREDWPLTSACYTHRNARYGILELDRLVENEALYIEVEAGAVMLGNNELAANDSSGQVEDGRWAFMLVEIAGERYAFRIEDVVQLVVLSGLRTMPHAPSWVSGLVNLRGDPSVVLQTASLLGRESASNQGIGIVVQFHAIGQVALLVDRALGIERFAPTSLYRMTAQMAGVESYLVMESEAIVGIISPTYLLGQVAEELAGLIPRVDTQQVEKIPDAGDLTSDLVQLLTFRIGGEFCALPLDRIRRIQASVQLTALPDPANGFDALADVGDAIVPILDLRRRVAVTADDVKAIESPCILVMLEGALAGLLVNQVLRIENIPQSRIDSVESAHQLPISQIAQVRNQLVSVLTLDSLLPLMTSPEAGDVA